MFFKIDSPKSIPKLLHVEIHYLLLLTYEYNYVTIQMGCIFTCRLLVVKWVPLVQQPPVLGATATATQKQTSTTDAG